MSKTSIPVIKFLFKEELKVLSDALNIGSGFEIEEFANSNDLSSYLSSIPAGLVITSLHDRNDLIQIATYMKLGKKVAKDCVVKIVVFNFSKDRNFEKAIAKLGILDVVDPGINTKALKFKIDFWMKSLNAQIKNNVAANPQKVKSLDFQPAADKKGPDASLINWAAPLDLEEDIWLLKHDNDCKKVLSKWLIRLLGPSPYVGQWAEVKAGLWRFDFKESEKEMYVSGDGAWFFSGDQKPDFVWKENIWLISGDNFDLFYKDSSAVSSRLNCKNKIISVCKNSEFAKTKEQTIIDSFDKELVFKREADVLEDLEGKNKTDQLNSGNLEGKNKTDEIDGGPLEGKSKTAAEKSGNLTGKTKGQEAIKHENLEQKTSTGREKTHWNNKNTYEDPEAKGALSVNAEKHRNGANLERENKDHEHKKYYKNHNEAEKYEAGELGKGLSGKASTDQVSSHSDNAKKAKDHSPSSDTERERELAGKGETDKLKSHYGRKENSEAQKEKEAKDMDGKSSTDKLASHYGGPKKAASEAHASERENKSSDRSFDSSGREKSGIKTSAEKERVEKADPASAPEREKAQREEKIQKEREEREKTAKPGPNERERESRNEAEETSLREAAERDKGAPLSAKERVEKNKETSESKNAEKKQREEEPEAKTRKGEQSENEERSKKTGIEKAWEGEHDYGFKGEDPLILNRRKKDEKSEEASRRGAEVFPLDKAREEKNKQKTAEENALDKITEDARVISILTHEDRQIHCGLDDFFDDTIIFHTDDHGITEASDVKLDLKFKFLEKDTQLKITGNILTIEDDGEGKNFVTVQLTKENCDAFDTFMKLFKIRQENVTEFLKKAKGY